MIRLPLIRSALIALIPIGVFLALFDPAVLLIGNAGWLIRGTDRGEDALGMHAWLHDSAAGWSLHTRLLSAPEGTGLLFTDSNPLLGLLLHPFAAWLPADTQVVGPWLLACCLLQASFAWALLRRHAPGFAALWCGVALLCALPTWYNRYLHPNLFAHFVILWALWVFSDAARSRRIRFWVGPIVVAALVHVYLLVIVAAIWASAELEGAVNGDRNPARLMRRAGGVMLILALIGVIAGWHGAAGFGVTGSYGAFAMPLDALWNPANPGYAMLLPATPQREGRGYEGFQYLGLGLLLLVPLALAIGRQASSAAPESSRSAPVARLVWLIPAFVVLTLIAISNYPDFAGHRLIRFALPGAIAPLIDVVRASGRLFWPVAYAIVLAAVLTIYRLDARRAGLILGVVLAIQLIDTARMIGVVRAQNEASDHRLYRRTVDPRWDSAIADAHDVTFMPGDATRDLALFQEIAWRAVTRSRPVRIAYTARTARATAARIAGEQRDFAAGRLDPHRLYVLFSATPAPASGAARLKLFDGVRVIVPVSRTAGGAVRPAVGGQP